MGHFLMPPPTPTPQEKSLQMELPSPAKEIMEPGPLPLHRLQHPQWRDGGEASPPWKASLPSARA